MAASVQLEIGVVYRRGNRLFLAVRTDVLVTFKDGAAQEVRPQGKYEVVRSISVEELCARWQITLDLLDATTVSYLAPAAEGLKTRPRGSRRTRVADEFAWRSLRMIRLAAS